MIILGCDPGYNAKEAKLAFCLLDTETNHFRTDSYKVAGMTFEEKCASVYNRAGDFYLEYLFIGAPDAFVLYNTAFGNVALKMSRIIGVLQGWAIAHDIERQSLARDNTVKSALLGNPNASKEQVMRFIKALHPEAPDSEDECEALLLCEFFRRRLE